MTEQRSSLFRIAIGQLSQESNSFVAVRTELDLFRNSYLHEGEEIWRLEDSDTEIGGMLATVSSSGAEVVPLIATRSVSGGPLSDTCYSYLKNALLSQLRHGGPVDGVLLSMHGSMLADGEDDPEGDLLKEIRSIVGAQVPIVVTLDLHGNVTAQMIRHADALVAYARYPHDDIRATGVRGADLLLHAIHKKTRPTMALAKVPMLVSGCEGQTFGDAPMSHLTRQARELERQPGVLSVSCFHVHPYLDQPGLGSGAVVVTDNDVALATALARALAAEFWTRRWEFMPDELSVAEAVERGRAIEGGPILLVDVADCCGGGATGDSVAVLRELLAVGATELTYLMVVDPAAAVACASVGAGQTLTIDLGYGLDPAWGEPITVTGRVRQVVDGRFRYDGGAYGGTLASMGRSAVLEIGGILVLVMSVPTYDWADEQFRAAGLDPRQAKFIGVKNPMNYRFAYRDLAKAAFIVRTPGPTPAQVRQLPYQRVQRPIFPFDDSPLPPRMDIEVGRDISIR